MDHITLESIAVETYRRHGFAPDEPLCTFKLARKVLDHPHPITRPVALLGRYPAALYRDAEQCWRISLRKTVPDDETRFYIGHELAHHLLGKPHGAGADIERWCDYLGACLLAPRPAASRLRSFFGEDFRAIAEELGCTQTWAALRLGEVAGLPLATVGPQAVRVRGPEDWVWPEEQTIRAWASGRVGPGVTKVRITDRPKRCVLRAV
jgi:hypothetical protein